MRFFSLFLIGCCAVFGCLFLLLRRRAKGRARALAFLPAIELLCAAGLWVYRAHDSFLGLAFRHNRGLLGGYLCVAAVLAVHVLWLAAALIHTKKHP